MRILRAALMTLISLAAVRAADIEGHVVIKRRTLLSAGRIGRAWLGPGAGSSGLGAYSRRDLPGGAAPIGAGHCDARSEKRAVRTRYAGHPRRLGSLIPQFGPGLSQCLLAL